MSAITDHPTTEIPKTGSDVETFVTLNEAYYARQFKAIGDKRGFSMTWNWAAFLLGSIWYGMRSLWAYFLPFVALETIAVVQLARGVWGDLGAPILARLPGIERTLAQRYEQLADAKENAPDRVAGFENAIASLERAVDGIKADAAAANAQALSLILSGLVALLVIKSAQAVLANPALQSRYSKWLSDRSLGSGLNIPKTAVAAALTLFTF